MSDIRDISARILRHAEPEQPSSSSQQCGRLPFDEGELVFCHDPRFPGPWIVKRVLAWGDALGKGDWRFYCVRPDGCRDTVRFGNYVIETPRAMFAWESELWRPSKREVVAFGKGVRSSALGGKPITAQSVQKRTDPRKAKIIVP